MTLLGAIIYHNKDWRKIAAIDSHNADYDWKNRKNENSLLYENNFKVRTIFNSFCC